MIAALRLTFPPEWSYLSAGDDSDATAEQLVADAEALGTEVQQEIRKYLLGVGSLLKRGRLAGLASMAHLDTRSEAMVLASCAIAFEPLRSDVDEPAAELAAAWPPRAATIIDSTAKAFEGALGRGVRAATTHVEPKIALSEEAATVIGDVRYVFPLDEETALLLHFSTPSVVYMAELSALFDAIAAKARLDEDPERQVKAL